MPISLLLSEYVNFLRSSFQVQTKFKKIRAKDLFIKQLRLFDIQAGMAQKDLGQNANLEVE
jgi:hypothetical protein